MASRKALRLLERARRSLSNWRRRELDEMYLGFGFEIRSGAKHDVVKHPKYPQLRTTLPRHGSLAKGYITYAISLIERLIELEGTHE